MQADKALNRGPQGQASREESLQKIIKNQELLVRDLERKMAASASGTFPEKARYENEIVRLQREVEFLGKKIMEMQNTYNQEKTVLNETLDRYRSSNDSLKSTIQTEKAHTDKKLYTLEETYKSKIETLESQAEIYEEELSRLRSVNSQDPYERMLKDSTKFASISDELARISDVFNKRESEYKSVIINLESMKSLLLPSLLTILFRGGREQPWDVQPKSAEDNWREEAAL